MRWSLLPTRYPDVCTDKRLERTAAQFRHLSSPTEFRLPEPRHRAGLEMSTMAFRSSAGVSRFTRSRGAFSRRQP